MCQLRHLVDVVGRDDSLFICISSCSKLRLRSTISFLRLPPPERKRKEKRENPFTCPSLLGFLSAAFLTSYFFHLLVDKLKSNGCKCSSLQYISKCPPLLFLQYISKCPPLLFLLSLSFEILVLSY